MDIFFYLLSFFAILALAKINISLIKKRKAIPPEPPGALPLVGHLHLMVSQSPLARVLGTMADQNGPVFSLRLGNRRAMVVSNWETIKECFTTNDRAFATRPDTAAGRYIGYDNVFFSHAPYGPYWRDTRKMVTQELLTNQRLEKIKHVIDSELNHSIKDLLLEMKSSNAGEISGGENAAVNLSKWFEQLTLNVILRVLVGKRLSAFCDENVENGDWKVKEVIKKALYLSGVFVVSDVIRGVEWMDIGGHVKAIKEAGKEFDKLLQGWLMEHVERRKQKQSDADFMDVLLSAFPEDTEKYGHSCEVIIKSTIAVLILTSTESTAETLIWALSLLLNNPHILKLVKDELDTKVGKNRWVDASDLNNLKHLDATMKETLRLYPPGPLSGPREASEDCHMGDYFVPKGTRLIVNLWKLHRDPRVWCDPMMFKPERFLDEKENVSYKGQNFEYIPFSSGRRMCPAVNYGVQVVQLSLARLIQGFDMETPMGECVDMREGLGISLPKVKPLEVILTPRLPSELYQNL